jgi:hypothetical protein
MAVELANCDVYQYVAQVVKNAPIEKQTGRMRLLAATGTRHSCSRKVLIDSLIELWF